MQRFLKKNLILTSAISEAGLRMIRANRCIYVDRGRIPFTNKSNPLCLQMSGVNDDCYVHYYIQQQNTSIAMETFLSTPAPVLKQWPSDCYSSLRVGLM